MAQYIKTEEGYKPVNELAEAIPPMTPATTDEDGLPGLVPAPAAGQQDMVLHGDGTWRAVEGGGGSGGGGATVAGEWEKLGDISVTQTYEFNPISFTGGVVTLDTSAEGYDFMSSDRIKVAFHPINIASDSGVRLYELRRLDYAAGTFNVYSMDGAQLTSEALDVTVWKMSVPNIGKVVFSEVPDRDRYKVRISTPAMQTHGIRPIIAGNVSALSFPAMIGGLRSGGLTLESEVIPLAKNSGYAISRRRIARDKTYGAGGNHPIDAVAIVTIGAGQTKPVNGTIEFSIAYCPFVNGTRFELWGGKRCIKS